MTIKHEITFDMLMSLMKKNHTLVLCGKNETEPSIEISLEQDEIPEDLEDALWQIENYWNDV